MAAKTSPEENSSTEVEAKGIDWGKIGSLDEARAALLEQYGAVFDSSALFGDGAEFIKDKNELINVPFLILDWRFVTDPDTKNEYVSVLIMHAATGAKGRFNDGSTGIYSQLKQVTAEYGVNGGIAVKHGLRKSTYTKEVDGKPQSATTFYLSS
jgi:hypothetical protein